MYCSIKRFYTTHYSQKLIHVLQQIFYPVCFYWVFTGSKCAISLVCFSRGYNHDLQTVVVIDYSRVINV